MDTKAFVENTVSRALDKYLELHPDASASGTVLPSGGATGQYLVKKSNTDYDAEWKDLIDADGWGVAKSGIVSVSIENQTGQFTVDISDLGLVNSNDYHIALTVVGGGTGAWGASSNFIWGKTATSFSGTVTTEGSDVDRVDLSYIIVAKGFGVGGIGTDYGIAKVGFATVTFNNSQWSDNITVSIAALHFESNDYITFVEPASGGTVGAWGSTMAHVASHAKDNFVIGAYSPENLEGTLIIKYILIAKGYSSVGGGGGSRLPEGGRSDQILAKKSDEDQDVGWVTDTGKNLVKKNYAYGSQVTQAAITSLPGEVLGAGQYARTRIKIPKTSAITSFADLFEKAGTDFYFRVDFQDFTQVLVCDVQASSHLNANRPEFYLRCSSGSLYLDGGRYYYSGVVLYFVSEDGSSIIVDAYVSGMSTGMFAKPLYAPLDTLSIIAYENKSVGTTTEAIPNYVSNVTGVVLRDLQINGSTVPTTWGVARIANLKMYMTNKQSYQYLWIGDLGFTSVDDYAIFVDVTGGTNAAWGKPTVIVSNKSATEAGISLECDSAEAEWFNVNYVIIGKGFGNIAASNIIESPNGTKYRLKVADDGTLSTEAV